MILDYKKQEELLDKYGIKRPLTFFVNSKQEAIEKVSEVKFPLVLKISSTKHLHRTELGGVITNIKNIKELEEGFDTLKKIEEVDAIIIQKQISGIEFIIGGKNDLTFGSVIMFGTGGTFVELFKDVSFKVAPIKIKDAFDMIDEIKGKKLLDGFRGGPVIDKNKLAEVLVKVSDLIYYENIQELDLNPIILTENEIFICDVKISL